MTDEDYLIVRHLTTKQLTRIFSRIRVNKETGCWECTRNLNFDDYGRFNHNGRAELAYRLIYAWLIEPLPRNKGKGKEKLELDHYICDNPPCCNPLHLRLGTQRQNAIRCNSPIAANAKKTHCVNGHLLPSEPNRYSKGKWRRRCLACQREVEKRRPPRPYRENLPRHSPEETPAPYH